MVIAAVHYSQWGIANALTPCQVRTGGSARRAFAGCLNEVKDPAVPLGGQQRGKQHVVEEHLKVKAVWIETD
jgi:hypothetical protein